MKDKIIDRVIGSIVFRTTLAQFLITVQPSVPFRDRVNCLRQHTNSRFRIHRAVRCFGRRSYSVYDSLSRK